VVRLFGRRSAACAASLAFCIVVAAPLGAQPQEPGRTQAPQGNGAPQPERKPPVPAEAAQPQPSEKPPAGAETAPPKTHDANAAPAAEPSENGRADNAKARVPESPFAEVFSQLAGRLVGVVVNELNPSVVNRQRDRQYA